MRILVLGAGATGGYFGGRMVEAGLDVTFLVRDKRRAALMRDGLVIKSVAGDVTLKVKAITALELKTPFDLVLLSAKAYDLAGAIDAVAPAMGEGSAVLPLLNGMAHLDALSARFGKEKVLGGCCYGGFTLDAQGVVHHTTPLQSFYFGEIAGGSSPRIDDLAKALATVKFEFHASAAILQQMWEKWMMLAALAASTTLAGGTVGEIMATVVGEDFVRSTLAETAAVATACGHPPSAAALDGARALLTQRGSGFAASMYRDMQRGLRTEVAHILGDMLRRGGEKGAAAPILRAAITHLEIYEAQRKSSAS